MPDPMTHFKAAARTALDEPMWRISKMARVKELYWRRRFAGFGRGSILYRPNWLYGTHKMVLGSGVLVLPGAWLAVERQAWDSSDPVLVIGDRVGIRTNVTLSAAVSVVIEDDVVFGGSVTVVDSDHTYRNGNPNVLHNPVDPAPIRIGRGSWIGDHSTVLKGSTIGEFCMIGANSVVKGDIPDRSVAVGTPARVVGTTDAPR